MTNTSKKVKRIQKIKFSFLFAIIIISVLLSVKLSPVVSVFHGSFYIIVVVTVRFEHMIKQKSLLKCFDNVKVN